MHVLKYGVTKKKVKRLSRKKCEELLTSVGIQCYDHESVEVLREAVFVNVMDDTIDFNSLP